MAQNVKVVSLQEISDSKGKESFTLNIPESELLGRRMSVPGQGSSSNLLKSPSKHLNPRNNFDVRKSGPISCSSIGSVVRFGSERSCQSSVKGSRWKLSEILS